jgi:Ca2+-transporting ATPase
MSMKNKKTWWNLFIDDVCQYFSTSTQLGLTTEEAAVRIERYGYNQLPEKKRYSALKILLSQFSNVIVWVLFGALVISAFLGEWLDGLVISIIMVLNALIGFIQEYSAEKTLAALHKLTTPMSRVMRDGILRLMPSTLIVPGDVIVLEPGDWVPADGRLITTSSLITQESALTGESTPVCKNIEIIKQDDCSIADRSNMVFMGTSVVHGKGYMVVTETGTETELGLIATQLQKAEEARTPLQIQLDRLGHRLVMFFIGVTILTFLIGILRGYELIPMFMSAISLAVAAIPEGLPAVVTITLAAGVHKMAKRHALVRRLASVETLGCATVICTDKTGTLTQNEMSVRVVWVNEEFISVSGGGYAPQGSFIAHEKPINPRQNSEFMMALHIGVLCNNASLFMMDGHWTISGDPTEGALLTVAGKAGLDKTLLDRENPEKCELPFDADRKLMSVLRTTPKGSVLFVKGAPDSVMQRVENILIHGKIVSVTQDIKDRVADVHKQLAQKALRVLAVAYRDNVTGDLITHEDEQKLTFVGLFAMMDPPRQEARVAIAECKNAGILPVMITGDHPETAIAIARELGMVGPGIGAVTGLDLDRMSDEDLYKNIKNIAVYARTSASHKMRIIKTFRARGDVVAMTGDGVNDAPAIKAADIGIAMGLRGTEVTKEAADMVITDDNFASIVHAIEAGRGIYDNIVKFVNYQLSTHVAEVLIIFMSALLRFTDPEGNPFIALLPIQILWINLVTDGLPAVALGFDKPHPGIMKLMPRKASDPILSGRLGGQLLSVGLVLTAGTLAAAYIGLQQSACCAHTMTLTTLVILEMVRVHMVRAFYGTSLLSNVWVLFALVSSILLQLLIVYVPFLQTIFKTQALGLYEWLAIFSIVIIVWIVGLFVQSFFKKGEFSHVK